MNMGERNKGKENQMASYIDEDLQRALKLSLNPEEQMTKEQRDFVLACKESLVQSKEPPDYDRQNKGTFGNRMETNSVVSDFMKDDEEAIYLDDDIDDLYDHYPLGGLSDIILSHGNKYVEKTGKSDKNGVVINKNINSIESLKSGIECVKSNNNGVIAELSTETGSKYNSIEDAKNSALENVNSSTSNAKKSPTKNSNKKKRKATAAENITKAGNINKPIPLAKAAAAVHEAPVCKFRSIHDTI